MQEGVIIPRPLRILDNAETHRIHDLVLEIPGKAGVVYEAKWSLDDSK